MERDLVKRAYPLWKLCIALMALLALLFASESFFRLPGGHLNAHAASGQPNGDPIFMQYEGITGDVTAAGYEHQIELTSFQWGVGRAFAIGADRESAIPKLSEITITKPLDSSSPKLLQEALNGTGKTVTINFVNNNQGQGTTYLQIILSNTLVSSFSMSSGGDRPTESLSLNFTRIEVKYPGFPDNTGAIPDVRWDLVLVHPF